MIRRVLRRITIVLRFVCETVVPVVLVVFFSLSLIWTAYFTWKLIASKELDPKPFAGVHLQHGVHYATSRCFVHGSPPCSKSIRWLTDSSGEISLKSDDEAVVNSMRHEIIILVHGYRTASPELIVNYFDQVIDYLRSNANADLLFIVYDWQSWAREYGPLEEVKERRVWNFEAGQYAIDILEAEGSGATGLLQLLTLLRKNISSGAQISILAHSMGALVVTAALRKDPSSFDGIQNMVWLAPDVAASIFDDNTVRRAVGGIKRLAVFWSQNDNALWFSRIANHTKRLGLNGPSNSNNLPGNIEFIDVTEKLGKADVHSKYVSTMAASILGLAQLLNTR